MSKRSPEEILRDIEDSEVDDVIERVLAMSPEDRRRELEARDVDVGALHAKADALHAQIHRSDAVDALAKVAALPTWPRRPARTVWAVSLIAAALGAVVVAVALHKTDDNVAAPWHADEARAAKVREEAYAACDARQWRACGDKLHEAKRMDPAGDADPRVQVAYKAAFDGLVAETEAGAGGRR
jgi:hypothetical protein